MRFSSIDKRLLWKFRVGICRVVFLNCLIYGKIDGLFERAGDFAAGEFVAFRNSTTKKIVISVLRESFRDL
jgi:hypothetical protein